jgi:hypothetical protein
MIILVMQQDSELKFLVIMSQEQTKFGECLLLFGSETFVIPPAVQECKG